MKWIIIVICIAWAVQNIRYIKQRDHYKRMAELMADYIDTEVPKRRITGPFMMGKMPAWEYFYNLAKDE